ncbi:hypothetical protein E4U21_000350 [Claviceps maximensis]|nr:hypothetical protein E4U21_000350 [Claviceps maximensis]
MGSGNQTADLDSGLGFRAGIQGCHSLRKLEIPFSTIQRISPLHLSRLLRKCVPKETMNGSQRHINRDQRRKPGVDADLDFQNLQGTGAVVDAR